MKFLLIIFFHNKMMIYLNILKRKMLKIYYLFKNKKQKENLKKMKSFFNLGLIILRMIL